MAGYTVSDANDPLTISREGTVYSLLTDGTSSIRQLADETGLITDTFNLDAFGNVLYRSGSTSNNLFLHGQYHDDDTGLYYLRARWMDPTHGTFLSIDPATGNAFDPRSFHSYLYAHNNPLRYQDIEGRFSTLIDVSSTLSIQSVLMDYRFMMISYMYDVLEVADTTLLWGYKGYYFAITSAAEGLYIPGLYENSLKTIVNGHQLIMKKFVDALGKLVVKNIFPIKVEMKGLQIKWLEKNFPKISSALSKYGSIEWDIGGIISDVTYGGVGNISTYVPTINTLKILKNSVKNYAVYSETLAKGKPEMAKSGLVLGGIKELVGQIENIRGFY